MLKNNGFLYEIVDEEYLKKFNAHQLIFMKEYYYSQYCRYCENNKKRIQSNEKFFLNMRRKRIKLLQMLCPYCGEIRLVFKEAEARSLDSYKYCGNCGKTYPSETAFMQLSRIIRIIYFHEKGLQCIKSIDSKSDTDILTYDIYQLELIEIASILEVVMRDFFEAFVSLKYFNAKDKYLSDIIKKNINNDFLNVDKANEHYKKALNLNLKNKINQSDWLDLIDLANMRNTIVHNNGFIDNKFKSSLSYKRLEKLIKGDLIFLSKDTIKYYILKVNTVINVVTQLFEDTYLKEKYAIIAEHYFNENNEE